MLPVQNGFGRHDAQFHPDPGTGDGALRPALPDRRIAAAGVMRKLV
jgi:hypothetical protein